MPQDTTDKRNRRRKAFLKGLGSTVTINPASDCDAFRRRMRSLGAASRIGDDWARVGRDLLASIRRATAGSEAAERNLKASHEALAQHVGQIEAYGRIRAEIADQMQKQAEARAKIAEGNQCTRRRKVRRDRKATQGYRTPRRTGGCFQGDCRVILSKPLLNLKQIASFGYVSQGVRGAHAENWAEIAERIRQRIAANAEVAQTIVKAMSEESADHPSRPDKTESSN